MTTHRLAASITLALIALLSNGSADAQTASQPDPNPATPVAPAPVPPSANDARAKMLYEQADHAYSQGKYSLALALFQESYSLSQRALILVAMANTQERLGDLKGALSSLRTYAEQADLSKEPNIAQRISALETRINAAESKAEQERLAREAAAQKAAETPPVVEPQPEPLAEQASPAGSPRWPWIVVGSGSAAILAGVSFALVASSARGKVDGQCDEALNGDVLCLPGAQKYLDRDKNFSLLADISVGVGVAAIATGVVFLLLPRSEDNNAGPNIAVGPDSMSVTLQGSF